MTELMFFHPEREVHKTSLIERTDSTMSMSVSSDDKSIGVCHVAERLRLVSFAPTVSQVITYVPGRHEYTESEKAQIYWLQEDLTSIRIRAKLNTIDIRKNQVQDINSIDKVFGQAQQLAHANISECEFRNVLESGRLSEPAQMFQPWCLKTCGRGLERYVSDKHRADRGTNTAQARQVVVRMSQAGSYSTTDIATAYRKCVRPALIYARIAGVADAMAATGSLNFDFTVMRQQGMQFHDCTAQESSTTEACDRLQLQEVSIAAENLSAHDSDTVLSSPRRSLVRQNGLRFQFAS